MFSEKYINYVKKTANPHYTLEMAACALMEELIEFDEALDEDKKDELSDVYYQFVLFVLLTGIEMYTLEYLDSLKDSIQCILYITSQFKKLITRGKQLDIEAIKNKLDFIYSDIIDATEAEGLTVEEVEEYNMDKLDRRYANVDSKAMH